MNWNDYLGKVIFYKGTNDCYLFPDRNSKGNLLTVRNLSKNINALFIKNVPHNNPNNIKICSKFVKYLCGVDCG